MVTLKVISTTANLRSEPSSAKGDDSVVASFPSETRITQLDYVRDHPDWIRALDPNGREGFIKRSLLAQVDPGAIVEVDRGLLVSYDRAVRSATSQYDGVKYGLGSKRPNEGKVDCSGWIAFINRLAFNAVNAAAGWKVFSTRVLGMLNTHSDHQVSIPGYEAKQLFSGPTIERIPWRPGLLIGINFGDYDWERGQGRVFEIDHIVQTMSSANGSMHVTQSSSGGGGVNSVRLEDWLEKAMGLIARYRLHVVDIFALANLAPERGIEGTEELELPEPDLSRALPG